MTEFCIKHVFSTVKTVTSLQFLKCPFEAAAVMGTVYFNTVCVESQTRQGQWYLPPL